MLPFRFTVDGLPLSHQTKNRANLRAWQRRVLAAARKRWGPASQPESRVLEFELVYFHPGESVRIDNDNMFPARSNAALL